VENGVRQSALRGDVTWEALADGRPHRLKRGKHYAGDLRNVTSEAIAAATEMEKGVRVVRDNFGRWQYVWVQFADHAIPYGAPCPCGSRRILRVHEHYGRCSACGVTLIFRGAASGDSGRLPERDLSAYRDVQLRRFERQPDRERWHGYALSPTGERVLLIVDYLLGPEGDRIEDPLRPGEPLYKLRRWPIDPFVSALDLESLWPDEEDAAEDETGASESD
jgi:hypothetical protein